MDKNFTTRTELILGKEGIDKLKKAHILVVGVGGVGSFCVEALARAGVGNLTIVDYSKVEKCDINRQIPGLNSNLCKNKVSVVKERLIDINEDINIISIKDIFNEDTSENIFKGKKFDYVVDAIDMVSSKIHLIKECKKRKIPMISSMGMGNKLDPTKIEISDISKTHTCPLAKVIRRELRHRDINSLKVVFSTENPMKVKEKISNGHRILPGSISFMSSSGGLIIASEVVKDILLSL